MRKFAFLFLVVLLASCGEDPSINSLSGQWRLVHYYNLQTAKTTSAPLDLAKSITLNFSDDGLKGSFIGHTLESPISGKYELTKPGRIWMTPVVEIPSEQNDLAKIMVQGLGQVSTYKVSNYSLNLYFHEGKEVLIFVRL